MRLGVGLAHALDRSVVDIVELVGVGELELERLVDVVRDRIVRIAVQALDARIVELDVVLELLDVRLSLQDLLRLVARGQVRSQRVTVLERLHAVRIANTLELHTEHFSSFRFDALKC